MEHASGVSADTRWLDITKPRMRMFVTGIVDTENKFFDISFASIGSPCFKQDVPDHLQRQLYTLGAEDTDGDSEVYCIGPIADYMFWYGKRAELELIRGPSVYYNMQSVAI